MSTPVRNTAYNSFASHGSAAAASTMTITLPATPSGQCCVIDSISVSFSGTVNVSSNVVVRVAGAGSTRWDQYFGDGTAGIGTAHYPFPGGLKLPVGESIEVVGLSLSNCTQRGDVTGHFEGAS